MNILTIKNYNLFSYLPFIMVAMFFFAQNITAQNVHPYEDTARQHIGVGEFSKAIPYFKKVQKVYVSQQRYEEYLMTYAGLFMCFQALEEIDSMEKVVHDGLEIAEKYTLTESPIYAYILQAAGVLYHEKEAYAKALWVTQKNIDLLKKLGEDESPESYNNVAAIYRRFGDFDAALEYYNKALKLEPNNPLFFHNIGVVLIEKGEYKNAIAFFNRSLNSGKNKDKPIFTYINLGQCYQYLGDCDTALSYFEKAEALVNSPMTQSRGLYRVFALAHACKKQYTEAHDYINIAITQYPKRTKHPLLGKGYKIKANIYAAQNKHQEALKNYELALNNLVSNFDKTQKIELDSVLSNPELLETLIGQGESKTALKHPQKDILELYVLATELIDSMRVNFINDNSEYHLIEKSIPTIYETAIKLALEIGDKQLAFELSEKSKANVLLEKTQTINSRKYLHSVDPINRSLLTFAMFQQNSSSTVFSQTFKINNIQTTLEKGQVLISYFVGAEKTYAFVMNQQRIDTFSFANIQQKDIKSLITSLENSECAMNSTEYTKLAYEIYQKTLQPIEQFGEYKRLIIIPDELLSSIPFDALLTSPATQGECRFSQLSYVVKKYSIGYAYSANLWLFNKEKSNSKESNKYKLVDFSTPVCTDVNDSENHRIFFSDMPLLSSEIETMGLTAKLAILSACETGLDTVQRGNGVRSLARSFTIADCPSVVMNLWKVNDESTKEIMEIFHQYLVNGKPQDIALQKAKQDYLKGKYNAEMNPYYWAAFVQIGDADSLEATHGSSFIGYLLVLLGVVGVGFFMVWRKKNS